MLQLLLISNVVEVEQAYFLVVVIVTGYAVLHNFVVLVATACGSIVVEAGMPEFSLPLGAARFPALCLGFC